MVGSPFRVSTQAASMASGVKPHSLTHLVYILRSSVLAGRGTTKAANKALQTLFDLLFPAEDFLGFLDGLHMSRRQLRWLFSAPW